MENLRVWKKVFENDLESIILEMKESLSCPCIIILTGEVGAGKTTFTKKFVQMVSHQKNDNVMSPTYSILNESGSILHGDLYRLKSPQELIHLELPLYLEDKEYFLVEWGKEYYNVLIELIPEDFLFYELKIEINELKDAQEVASRNIYLDKLDS